MKAGCEPKPAFPPRPRPPLPPRPPHPPPPGISRLMLSKAPRPTRTISCPPAGAAAGVLASALGAPPGSRSPLGQRCMSPWCPPACHGGTEGGLGLCRRRHASPLLTSIPPARSNVLSVIKVSSQTRLPPAVRGPCKGSTPARLHSADAAALLQRGRGQRPCSENRTAAGAAPPPGVHRRPPRGGRSVWAVDAPRPRPAAGLTCGGGPRSCRLRPSRRSPPPRGPGPSRATPAGAHRGPASRVRRPTVPRAPTATVPTPQPQARTAVAVDASPSPPSPPTPLRRGA